MRGVAREVNGELVPAARCPLVRARCELGDEPSSEVDGISGTDPLESLSFADRQSTKSIKGVFILAGRAGSCWSFLGVSLDVSSIRNEEPGRDPTPLLRLFVGFGLIRGRMLEISASFTALFGRDFELGVDVEGLSSANSSMSPSSTKILFFVDATSAACSSDCSDFTCTGKADLGRVPCVFRADNKMKPFSLRLSSSKSSESRTFVVIDFRCLVLGVGMVRGCLDRGERPCFGRTGGRFVRNVE